jgi:signal transduction histidine kinase
METSNKNRDRTIGRRESDFIVHDQLHKLNLVAHVGQTVTSFLNIDELFDVIIEQTNQIMQTERSTLFLYEEKHNILWSFVATGMKKNTIRIPVDHGVAGWVFQQQQPLILNDPYNDKRFYMEIDRQSGFTTKNILCIPIINRRGACIGVFQALNKTGGLFDDNDRELLTALSHYVAIALENAALYEDLKSLYQARERIINHLSHELRTPLAIILGVIDRVTKKLEENNVPGMEKALDRAQRNLSRLLDLQSKIEDVLEQRTVREKTEILNIIESAAGIVTELEDETDIKNEERAFIRRVSERLEALFTYEESGLEEVRVDECLHEACDEALRAMQGRELKINRSIEEEILLTMDRKVLMKMFSGLLRNAIENTPDGGLIEVSAKSANGDGIQVSFRDYGIGITEDDRKNVFVGFFHTQDTNLYSTKKPYEFNAGGAGADLLRTKVFSERYGFSIQLESDRCAFRPSDADECPGKITTCSFIADAADCLNSGGTTFSIHFPGNGSRGSRA